MNKIKILLVGWGIFIFLTTLFYINQNKVLPSWDEAYYLHGSEILYKSLHSGISDYLNSLVSITPRKPPLIAYLTTPFFLLFGNTYHSALYTNLFYFILFVVFFYLLLKRNYSEKIALSAILLMTLFPLFTGLQRQLYVEFGLMSIVIVWFYLLYKTELFQKDKYIFLLGLVSGFGLLIKLHFPLFVIASFLAYVFRFIKKKPKITIAIKKAAILLSTTLVVIIPWYSRNILVALWHAKKSADPTKLGDAYYGPPFSSNNLYFSLTDFINFQISGYFFILLIVFIFLMIRKKITIKLNPILTFWFVFPFCIFFFGPNKDYRFMLPLLPPVAIFIAWSYWQLFPRSSLIKFFGLLLIPTIFYLGNTISFINLPNITLGPIILYKSPLGHYNEKPIKETWPTEKILLYLNSLEPSNKPKTITLISEYRQMNINNLQYFAYKDNLPLTIKSTSYSNIKNQKEIYDILSSTTYLIYKVDGEKGPNSLNKNSGAILSQLSLPTINNNFTFPDGGKLVILKR